MKRLFFALTAGLFLALALPASAADSCFASPRGDPCKVKYKDIGGGLLAPAVVTVDAAGNAIGADGKFAVQGTTAVSSAYSDKPLVMGGVDTTSSTVRSLATDGSGILRVVGSISAGSSSSAAPVQMGGIDSGGLVRKLMTNSSGTLQIVHAPSSLSTDALGATVTSVAGASLSKASAGNLYGWQVTAGASAGYVLIFNATAAPADGTVTPVQCVQVDANKTVSGGMEAMPERYSTGISLVFSTTGCFTKTASATAFIRARWQ